MNEFGLLITSIVLNSEIFNGIMTDFYVLNKYREGIYENPFNYKFRNQLAKIEDEYMPNDKVYSMEYRMNGNNIFIYFQKNNIIIEHSRYLNALVPTSVIELLKKYIFLSELTIVGFETSLFINEYPENIDFLLGEKSLYPLYLYKKQNGHKEINFIKYALANSTNKMEMEIEDFLKNITTDRQKF